MNQTKTSRLNANFRFAGLDVIVFAAILFLLLIMSSVSIVVAAKIVAILLLQIFTGKEVYSIFVKGHSTSSVEVSAIGFSIGALIWLLFDQLFIALSLPHIGWLLPVLGALVIRIRKRADANCVNDALSLGIETVAWIAIASLLGLSGEWVWPFPFALLATAVLLIRKIDIIRRTIFDRAAILVLIVAGLITLATRPKIWWITQTDTHFYQAISTSVAKWGFRDSILTSDYSLKYHWFPYAWTGMVSRISDAPDWVVLTRVGPLIATLCIISLVWTITLRLVVNRCAAIVAVLVFAESPVFGDWSLSVSLAMFGSYSQLFATIWLLPILLWMIDVERGALRAPWVFVSLLLIGLVGGKVSHAAVALVAILCFELIRFFQKRAVRRSSVIESLVAVLTVVGATLFLFGTGGSLTWRPASWVPYVQGDLYGFRGIKLVLAMTVLVFGMLHLVALALLKGFFSIKKFSSVFVGVLSAVSVGVVLSNFSNFPTDPNGLFFIHSPLIIAYSLIAAVLFQGSDLTQADESISRKLVIPVAAGICAILFTYLIPNLDSGSISAVFFRASRSLIFIVAFLVVALSSFVFVGQRSASRLSFSGMALISLVVISLGTFVGRTAVDFPKNYANFDREGALFVESADLRSLSDWFDRNTTSNEIYASNYLCEDNPCASGNYSRKALVAAIVHRRTLVQSPWLAASYSSRSDNKSVADFNDRIRVSINFAKTPTSADLALLINWSVNWYIVDLAVTPKNYWTNSSAKVFENSSYLVVDINKVTLN